MQQLWLDDTFNVLYVFCDNDLRGCANCKKRITIKGKIGKGVSKLGYSFWREKLKEIAILLLFWWIYFRSIWSGWWKHFQPSFNWDGSPAFGGRGNGHVYGNVLIFFILNYVPYVKLTRRWLLYLAEHLERFRNNLRTKYKYKWKDWASFKSRSLMEDLNCLQKTRQKTTYL